MAMQTLATENLTQAYSKTSWEYAVNETGWVGNTGYGQDYACVLRFDIPAFAGVSETLDVALVCRSGGWANVTFRWAICTSDAHRELYNMTRAEVADENQFASGTATFTDLSNNVETKHFQLPTKHIQGGRTYYLFLWGYNDSGLYLWSVSSNYGNHSITLEYQVGGVRVKTAEGVKMFGVFLKQDGEVKQVIPYIKTPSGVKPGS